MNDYLFFTYLFLMFCAGWLFHVYVVNPSIDKIREIYREKRRIERAVDSVDSLKCEFHLLRSALRDDLRNKANHGEVMDIITSLDQKLSFNLKVIQKSFDDIEMDFKRLEFEKNKTVKKGAKK